MDEVSDEIEYTLLNKKEVMVYQIPPASSSSGHKAEDWTKCIWRGRMRIAGKGHNLAIKMLDPATGDLFAQCLIPKGEHEKYVERVVDSSRYFVLKISKGDRHTFIGIGFEDRNDAFDFNCSLSDFKSTWGERKEEETVAEQAPTKDLSFKEGEKITIKLAGMSGEKKKREERPQEPGFSPFGAFPAPPPSGVQSRRQAATTAPAAPAPAAPLASTSNGAWPPVASPDDSFGFDDFQSAPAPALAVPTRAASDSFGALGGGASSPASLFGAQPVANAFSQPAAFPPAFPAAAPSPAFSQPQVSYQAFQPSTPFQQQPSLDPFTGLGGFGGPTAPVSAASPAPSPFGNQGFHSSPVKASAQKDPFDEFDIFK